MRITLCLTDTRPDPWVAGLRAALPGAEIDNWTPGAPQADHAVVWMPPQAFVDDQPALRGLFNIGAGVDALLALDLPAQLQAVVSQARQYDAAAFASYPGLFASRRNYDVVGGQDAGGRSRTGVLEQSWRMGGASSAEIAALDAFRADPTLRAVRASSVEAYGNVEPPGGAIVYFHGIDDRIGPMVRYAKVTPHA
jgi:hypothetical protein